MRILHLVHTYLPRSHGGIQTCVAMLAGAQLEMGDEPFILAGSEASEDSKIETGERVGGIPVQRLATPVGQDTLGNHPRTRAAIQKHVKAIAPDVVHLHHWHNLVPDAVEAITLQGIPCVITLHDFYSNCPLFFRMTEELTPCPADVDDETCAAHLLPYTNMPVPWIISGLMHRREIFHRELHLASACLAISEAQAKTLRQIPSFAAIDIRCTPLPSPTSAPTLPSPRLNSEQPLRILSVGGLVPGKGFHILVEACMRLVGRERIDLHHYGHTPIEDYRHSIQVCQQHIRLDVGGSFPEDKDVHAGFDLAVFPSLFAETHGYAVDEALGAGLPVIVSDRGAPQERVGGRGIVTKAGDVADLAAALQLLLDDPEALRRLREAPFEPRPTREEFRDTMRAIYEEACSSPEAGGSP